MNDIDWSEAPENYPIWVESLDGVNASDWHRDDGDRYIDRNGRYWLKPEGALYRVHANPAEQWTGSGLPPVGTVCEVFNVDLANAAWEQCTVLFLGQHRVVYDSESCSERVGYIEDLKFRLIRTPDQIAAEERKKAIDEMEGILTTYSAWDICAELYDAGFRKQETAK